MNWFMLANELIQHSRNTSIATAVVLGFVGDTVVALVCEPFVGVVTNKNEFKNV